MDDPAANCNLTDDQVYHYWLECTDIHPKRSGQRIRITEQLPDAPPSTLPPNNRIVIYELPTAWTRVGSDGLREAAANFAGLATPPIPPPTGTLATW